MKNLVLLIPDGVGVRNFLFGPFIQQARRFSCLHILSAIPDEVRDATGLSKLGRAVEWHALERDRDGALRFFLRTTMSYAHMYWANTVSMRRNLAMPITGSTFRRRAMRRTTRLLGRLAAWPYAITTLQQWFFRMVARTSAVQHYRRLFTRLEPSLLFCSHQRPLEVIPPVVAARSLGIPTATFIFSWDNLTSKGRIAAPFDHYLVWSEQMFQELQRYYPDIASDRIHLVGTPQFDPYDNETLLWSRDEFFRRVGADPSLPLVCYSGGDVGTCPEDPDHVRILLDQIRLGNILHSPQVLLRPSPVDPGTRYDGVRARYPELLYARPAWIGLEGEGWADAMPLEEDVQFLANLAHHCDLNINMASTMTLDFAIHDKPVVNVAFDVASPPLHGTPIWEWGYNFEHYRPVVELRAARFARSPDDLVRYVNAYIKDPTIDSANRRQLVELEVGWPIGQCSRRVVEVLEQICR